MNFWQWACCYCVQYSATPQRCVVCEKAIVAVAVPPCRCSHSSRDFAKCLVLELPRHGYSRGATLHAGVVESEGGVVHDLRAGGVHRGVWTKRKRARLLQVPVPESECVGDAEWDEALRRHSAAERDRPYHERSNNCLDFAVRFLNAVFRRNEPQSRHVVAGLLLAPILGAIQLEQQVRPHLSTRSAIWVVHLPTVRARLSPDAPALLCDACRTRDVTTRSCRECCLQCCSVCVFLHVCR
jgi:hypothetical protein